MERKIIHLNIADFGVAVERLLDTTLRKAPLILAQQASRSIVYDMSEEAYQDGVRKGMLLGAAQKRCRTANVLAPRPEKYEQVLGRCIKHARQYSPLVERAGGNGHLYIDVTGTHRIFGPPPDIGWRLRKTLRRDLGLDPIWSVAPNKLTAKVASRLVKPFGEYIVAAGEESIFLDPLPLHLLPGISAVDLAALRAIHLSRVYQVKALSAQELNVICGGRAQLIYHTVRGVDHTPVQTGQNRRENNSFEYVFTPDTNMEQVVRTALADLVARAGYSLRIKGLGCRKVTVQLTYTDGIHVARTAVDPQPVADDRHLENLALTALYRAWRRRVRLRRITLSCSRRCRPVRQLGLFDNKAVKDQKNRSISQACDVIHKQFGSHAVQRGMRFDRQATRAAGVH